MTCVGNDGNALAISEHDWRYGRLPDDAAGQARTMAMESPAVLEFSPLAPVSPDVASALRPLEAPIRSDPAMFRRYVHSLLELPFAANEGIDALLRQLVIALQGQPPRLANSALTTPTHQLRTSDAADGGNETNAPACRQNEASPMPDDTNLLEAIIDSTPDALIVTDPSDRITRLNRQAQALLGIAAGEAVGRPLSDVLTFAEDRPRQVTPEAPARVDAYLTTRPSEPPLPVERLRYAVRAAFGTRLGTAYVLRDLRRVQGDERQLTNLLSLVSHELRTPLAHIKGYTSTLLQTDVTWDAETQREFIAGIDRQVDRLSRLIRDLLDDAWLDGGGDLLDRKEASVLEVLDGGIRTAALDIADHPLTTVVPGDLPLILADAGRVERVVGNLVENAAKYSPRGAPVLVEATGQRDDVVISVIDRGLGIATEELPFLFDRFYRSPRVRDHVPGTGLGLTICKEVVEAHGGRIWAQSSPGGGSAFRFTLPCIKGRPV